MRLTRSMLAVAAAALVLTGCGSGGDDDKAAVPETATGSLEHLAAEVGCAPTIQIDADEIRQASCRKSDADGKFILATFATDRGQREWINGAKDYGGHYLVGRKWIAVGETKTVTTLRATLGGDIEEGQDHTAHSGSH
ncbi:MULTISPECIES: hypothetical protein [unclassified Streptomyces]|uniref:hypothetical protein n=1 Tax=unclassified Streptomyces TaxID=2593676 RepID=UPI00224EC942|nr:MULTISPECIES: hypothetical protein [unclassified Streptomyces]MCX5334645.1 hypothetical protein [Streptomyces sp. NBC_00140]MCX5364139.1 hypothetical protein [Streptomyces sp. NBC_00124]